MADGGQVFSTDRVVFMILAQLDIEGNIVTMIEKHPTSGLGGDAMTSLSMGTFTKSEPGTKRPNMPTDRNYFLYLHN